MSHSGEAWRRGRQKALKRDNHRCQDCGGNEGLHVHHIRRPEEFDSKNDSHHPSNLVTLCKYHHKKWEGVEARPILLGDGISQHQVVTSLVEEDIQKAVCQAIAPEAYNQFIYENPHVCDKCYKWVESSRRSRFSGIGPIETFRHVISRLGGVGRAEIGEIENILPQMKGGTQSRYVTCEDCIPERGNFDSSRTKMERDLDEILCRLYEKNIPVDEAKAEAVFDELKSDPGNQGMRWRMYRDAVEEGIKSATDRNGGSRSSATPAPTQSH